MPHVKVNGEETEAPASLIELLRERGIDPAEARGIAVARNGAVVRKQEWDATPIEEDDQIEIITATQGG